MSKKANLMVISIKKGEVAIHPIVISPCSDDPLGSKTTTPSRLVALASVTFLVNKKGKGVQQSTAITKITILQPTDTFAKINCPKIAQSLQKLDIELSHVYQSMHMNPFYSPL